jgi:hypothetical protein
MGGAIWQIYSPHERGFFYYKIESEISNAGKCHELKSLYE